MVRSLRYFSVMASTIFRAILHDPAIYPDPDAFKPERFLNSDGSLRDDPVLISTFGFGKRLCPGRHLAESTLFIVVACLLSVFKIEKGNDTDGGLDAYPYIGFGIRYSHGYRYSETCHC
jgi:cytochrome P450